MAEIDQTIVEVTCIVISAIELIALIATLITLCCRETKIEKVLKLVLVVLGLSIVMKAIYNCAAIKIDWTDHTNKNENLKFALWNLQCRSAGLMMIVFSILFAKMFFLLIAFTRKRLSKALELIKQTNDVIVYISAIVFTLMILDAALVIIGF